MKPNPYFWQGHDPSRQVLRTAMVDAITDTVRQGAAVKVIGGRGMGKSVLLDQVAARLGGEPGTRVALVGGPPEDATVPGAVRALAARLGVRDLELPSLADLLDRVLDEDVTRLVVLFDEADQYVTAGGADGAFARSWFSKLETIRKEYRSRFNVVFAGGLGLIYLEQELGSAIVSRAAECVLDPFTSAEIEELAQPFQEDDRPLDDTCLEALRVRSGGNPALVTYGLQYLWDRGAPSIQLLDRAFITFREKNGSFIRAVRASVSQHDRLDAPWRVLEMIRQNAGSVSLHRLRKACAPRKGESTTIDSKEALTLLRAAGLVRIAGSALADPVVAWPVASILNFPEMPTSSEDHDPIERLVLDVCAVLASMHRFARDFHQTHGKSGLFHEEAYSSMIAMGLVLLGWQEIEREPVQAAGFPDIKVTSVTQESLRGHILIEAKVWRQESHNSGVQQQLDEYQVANTQHRVVVTLGERKAEGWPEEYERVCLTGLTFERLPTPPDLVGRWRVRQPGSNGQDLLTDHLLVQLPKRTKPDR